MRALVIHLSTKHPDLLPQFLLKIDSVSIIAASCIGCIFAFQLTQSPESHKKSTSSIIHHNQSTGLEKVLFSRSEMLPSGTPQKRLLLI